MKFSAIFDRAKTFWPEVIDISDGKLTGGDGAHFGQLSSICRDVEVKASLVDSWQEIMSWAIFCGFHKLASARLRSGDKRSVKLSEIDIGYVQERFAQSLYREDSDWPSTMKEQYVNDYRP
jgi:hypothetical protein